IELISATTDLINNIVTWELGEIPVNKYAVLTYQVKSPVSTSQVGALYYNYSWDSKNFVEYVTYPVQTFNYTDESHLEFDIEAIQQPVYPWVEPRSAQINLSYNYSLKVTNIGDVATGTGWNVTLDIPIECNITQVYDSGDWNDTTRKITWVLSDIDSYVSAYVNFTANCTTEDTHIFVAEGMRNTTAYTTLSNDTSIGCSGSSSCSATESFSFTKPAGATYERMTEIDLYVRYNWTGYDLTIGQGAVNISDDSGVGHLIWQNYTFDDATDSIWSNYSVDVGDQDSFVDSARDISIVSYADATSGPYVNASVDKLSYTWVTGTSFSERQNLFANVKVYDYSPLLENSTLYIDADDASTVGGWGEGFNFSTMVMDRFGRDVTVNVWHKKSAGDYELIDSWVCTSCATWTQANFTYDYTYTDISSWEFKFNATNADGLTELSGLAYSVEKDDVAVYNETPGWAATVMRSSALNFTTRFDDTDNGTSPEILEFGKGYFQISKFGSNITFNDYYPASPVVNATGYMLYEMTTAEWCDSAKSYSLGPNYYITGLSGSSYYKDNSTIPAPYDSIPFTLLGNLSASYMTLPDGSINYTRGSSIPLDGIIEDDCGAVKSDSAKYGTEYVLSHGITEYSVIVSLATGSWDSPGNAPLGWYDVTMTTYSEGTESGDYVDGVEVLSNAFYLSTVPQSDYVSVVPASDGWSASPVNFTINVTDEDNDTVAVYLYLKKGAGAWVLYENWTCYDCNDNQTMFNRTFTQDEIDTWYYIFNASDQSGNVNVSLQSGSFTVEKDDISFTDIAPATVD
ncbi:MAG: hypothetical protein KAI18_03530, partial [Candidatus Aenigmarchaeota archaeon]|nr:hypothetical protein [Candidatus Aenigmarchaeota archaeon]